jgi:tRNA(Ile)-lysidine synthase
MTRTHPPTLITVARRALRDEIGLARGARVLVAVSGGPDSMALLHVMAGLAPSFDLRLHAHGVDHGLRAEAKGELDLAAALALKLGVPFDRTRVSLARGGNIQARARAARYAALREAARVTRSDRIATAHHADDRAETVLIRLLRGASAAGLGVLPPCSDDLIRPFIRARKAAILAHARRHAIDFAADPSNDDARFLRARVRRELMPLLEELDGGVVAHLCALADDLLPSASRLAFPRATRDALAALARSHSKTGRVLLPGGLVALVDRAQDEGRKRNRRATADLDEPDAR